jgi:RpiR family transcriptional regulator, carbohydrate utilization regulator
MPETTRPPVASGDLIQRIQERYTSLRKSERVVADYLRENAGTRLSLSITDFAQTLGISEATISRVSRALGYSGFLDLKLSLAEGAVARSGFSNIPAEIEQTDTLIATSAKLANLLSTALQGTQRMLDTERIDRCISTIREARKVVLVGVGGAAAICDEAAHLFMKAGLDAVSCSDHYTQVVLAANLGPQDVMLGISHTGTTVGVASALRLAREKSATTIAMTSDPSSEVARAAELSLITWNSATPSVPLYGDFLEGRISQIYLVDLLYIGLLFEEGNDRSASLRNTANALERFYQSSEGKA